MLQPLFVLARPSHLKDVRYRVLRYIFPVLSLEEPASLVSKLREIEEQASLALAEIPRGLTHSRVNHILILARFLRMKLEGRDVAPVEALPKDLRNMNKPPRKEE